MKYRDGGKMQQWREHLAASAKKIGGLSAPVVSLAFRGRCSRSPWCRSRCLLPKWGRCSCGRFPELQARSRHRRRLLAPGSAILAPIHEQQQTSEDESAQGNGQQDCISVVLGWCINRSHVGSPLSLSYTGWHALSLRRAWSALRILSLAAHDLAGDNVAFRQRAVARGGGQPADRLMGLRVHNPNRAQIFLLGLDPEDFQR